MRELGLPAASIRMMPTSTDKVPNTSATAASSGADLNGAAVRDACVTLRERLAPVAAELLAAKSGAPVHGGGGGLRGRRRARARGTRRSACPSPRSAEQAYRRAGQPVGHRLLPDAGHHTGTGKRGRAIPSITLPAGPAVSEVEVDGYTGMHRVLRVDIVHDVGDSLNPGIDRGQIEGGFVQGMGWLTREELLWDKEGRLQTHSASTYQIPAISDAPLEFHVTLLPPRRPGGHHPREQGRGRAAPDAGHLRPGGNPGRDCRLRRPGGEVPLASPATCEAIFTAVQERIRR